MNIDTNQIGHVMDRLGNGVNSIVESAKPLAIEIIRQYALREYVYSGLCFLFAIFLGVMAHIAYKSADKDASSDDNSVCYIAMGFLFIAMCVALVFCVISFGNAVAPIPSILKIR